jgi:citrate lyase subunit beta / citryl-CoA lyase
MSHQGAEGMRSFLFVPADSERKLAKGAQTAADALIYDLEDSVAPDNKAAARVTLSGWIKGRPPDPRTWIRVNEPGSRHLLDDLAAVVPLQPTGIVLPKIKGPEDVSVASEYLTMAEAIHGVALGSVRIIAVCTETPAAVLRIAELANSTLPRLAGLMWGGEDLSSCLGASDPRTSAGTWRPIYEHARTQCLLAARLLDVWAIDTVFVDVRNAEGCRQSALEARQDGFDGKVAVHPDQVGAINAAFTPTAEEVERAQRIVSAFEGGQGTVAFEGKMLDLPHLKNARRLLTAVGARQAETR